MTHKKRHLIALLRSRETLLEKQYYKQEVSKEADDYTEKVVKSLEKHGITVKVSQ